MAEECTAVWEMSLPLMTQFLRMLAKNRLYWTVSSWRGKPL